MAKFIKEGMGRRGAGNRTWPYTTSVGAAAWYTVGECYMGRYGPGASDISSNGFAYVLAPYNVDVSFRPQSGGCVLFARAGVGAERVQARASAYNVNNQDSNTRWGVDVYLERREANGATTTLAGPFHADKPTTSVPNEVRLVANYADVTLYINGAQVATTTDPGYAGRDATRHGIGHFSFETHGPTRYADNYAAITEFTLTKLNMPPLAPTALSPAGSNRRADQSLALQWRFDDNDEGDTQSRAEVSYRLGNAALSTQSVMGATESLTLTANSLLQGDYSWRLRTYDAAGIASPYTNYATFTMTGPRAGLETYNLAGAIDATATSITLLSGQGGRFPAERTGGYYLDLEEGGARERVLVHDRIGATLYIERAQGATTATAHPTRAAVRYDNTVARPPGYVQPTSVSFSDVSIARAALTPQYNDPAAAKVVASTSTALAGGVWYRNTVVFQSPRAILDERSGAANTAAPDVLAVGVSAYGDLPSTTPLKITGVQLAAPARTRDGVDFAAPGQAVVRVSPTRLNHAPNANFTTATTDGWQGPVVGQGALSTTTSTPWVGARALYLSAPAIAEPGEVAVRMALYRLRAGATYYASARVYTTGAQSEVALRAVAARGLITYASAADATAYSQQVRDPNALGANTNYRLIATSFTTPAATTCSWAGAPGASTSAEEIEGARRVNLCPNPALAVGTGGWRTYHDAERSAVRARSGTWAMRMTLASGSAAKDFFAPQIPWSGGLLALSAWVWSEAAVEVSAFGVSVRGLGAGTTAGQQFTVAARTWTRVSVLLSDNAATTTGAYLRVRTVGGGAGNYVYATDVLYEDAAEAVAAGQGGLRPYFDGDTGASALIDLVLTRNTDLRAAGVRVGGVLVEQRPGGDFFDHTTGDDYLAEANYPDGSGASFYYANYRLGAKALQVALEANTAAHVPTPLAQFARIPTDAP